MRVRGQTMTRSEAIKALGYDLASHVIEKASSEKYLETCTVQDHKWVGADIRRHGQVVEALTLILDELGES